MRTTDRPGAPQFFVDPADLDAEQVVVRGEEAHHAARVLRVKVGERILVADGGGRVAAAQATAVAPGEVRGRVEEVRTEPAPRPAITVVVCLLKAAKLDLVVQKLTELGVERIAPAAASRSVVHWDERKAAVAQRRWAAIALAAAKQARRARVPAVLAPLPLAEQVAQAGRPVLVCWEESTRPLADALPAATPDALTLVVGPEGGLEAAEVAACQAAGAVDVSLGRLVLRAETAAIAATAAVAFRYRLLG